MIPFDSEEEAIEIANDTPYGLTNYVQTQDPARAKRMSKKLLSGTVELMVKVLLVVLHLGDSSTLELEEKVANMALMNISKSRLLQAGIKLFKLNRHGY